MKPLLLFTHILFALSIAVPQLGHADSKPDSITVAQPPRALVAWIEASNGIYQILTSALGDDDKWSLPHVQLTSKSAIASPNFVQLNNGTHYLFWAQLDQENASIRYKTKQANEKKWRDEVILDEGKKENIGISVTRHADQLWVFWASTQNNLPDILYKTFESGVWSEAKPVHPANRIPDLKPRSYINDKNEIVVEWLTFSNIQSSYTVAKKSFDLKVDHAFEPDPIAVEDIKFPDFIPTGRVASAHFPLNTYQQSMTFSN